MPWTLTAQELVAAFRQVKDQPLAYPHSWARVADYDTYSALHYLHEILCSRLNSTAVVAAMNANALNPPSCRHPKQPPSHFIPSHLGGTYNTPAIALLAWQLAEELAAANLQFPQNDPDLILVHAYLRDAKDCD